MTQVTPPRVHHQLYGCKLGAKRAREAGISDQIVFFQESRLILSDQGRGGV